MTIKNKHIIEELSVLRFGQLRCVITTSIDYSNFMVLNEHKYCVSLLIVFKILANTLGIFLN